MISPAILGQTDVAYQRELARREAIRGSSDQSRTSARTADGLQLDVSPYDGLQARTADGRDLYRYQAGKSHVTSFHYPALSPDGSRAFATRSVYRAGGSSWGYDRDIVEVPLHAWVCTWPRSFLQTAGEVKGLAVSADGNLLAYGEDKTLRAVSLRGRSAALDTTLPEPIEDIQRLDDGRFLVLPQGWRSACYVVDARTGSVDRLPLQEASPSAFAAKVGEAARIPAEQRAAFAAQCGPLFQDTGETHGPIDVQPSPDGRSTLITMRADYHAPEAHAFSWDGRQLHDWGMVAAHGAVPPRVTWIRGGEGAVVGSVLESSLLEPCSGQRLELPGGVYGLTTLDAPDGSRTAILASGARSDRVLLWAGGSRLVDAGPMPHAERERISARWVPGAPVLCIEGSGGSVLMDPSGARFDLPGVQGASLSDGRVAVEVAGTRHDIDVSSSIFSAQDEPWYRDLLYTACVGGRIPTTTPAAGAIERRDQVVRINGIELPVRSPDTRVAGSDILDLANSQSSGA